MMVSCLIAQRSLRVTLLSLCAGVGLDNPEAKTARFRTRGIPANTGYRQLRFDDTPPAGLNTGNYFIEIRDGQ